MLQLMVDREPYLPKLGSLDSSVATPSGQIMTLYGSNPIVPYLYISTLACQQVGKGPQTPVKRERCLYLAYIMPPHSQMALTLF